MKALLMYRDRDFELQREPPAHAPALTQDLGLSTLFEAMALGDEYLLDVAQRGMFASLADPESIVYRQHILEDCLAQAAVVRDIYAQAVEAIQGERKIWRGIFESPSGILHRSVEVMQWFIEMLKRLREIADEHAPGFRSDGFARFFRMLETELSDDYFDEIDAHLRRLRFRGGVLVSAELGTGNKGTHYVLRRPQRDRRRWLERITLSDRSSYTLRIPDRDENGAKALGELRDRGINLAANALAQSVDHMLNFFMVLRGELGFYVGCLNLHERLAGQEEPVCLPVPSPAGRPTLRATGLYDVCLSLRIEAPVVGNDVDANDTSLVLVTGANQGGKSTFLRSVGLAQLMMQCGMFVAAESFSADVCHGVFTHYQREEDATMKSGKLDEELARMSELADQLAPGSIVLFNESFAATNEREGSAIARQIIRALREAGVKVVFVTHMFDLAHTLYLERADTALFLRAERRDDGQRTFKLIEGEPLPTSYGQDLYERIFGAVSQPASATRPLHETSTR
jgi:hypothetical protein